MAKKNRPGQWVVEYRRQASFRLSRICRESPLTGRPVFFATLLSLSRPAHWYTMDAQGMGMEIPALALALAVALAFAFGLRC